MQRTRWWMQAIGLGITAGWFIWLTSNAILVSAGILAQWGLVVLLRIVLVPLLACTAPLWIIAGLLWLVGAYRRPDQQGQRFQTVGDAATGRDGHAAGDAGERGSRAFRRRWSRRWTSFERGVVDWFVLSPALLEQRFETTGRGSGYLRRYLRGWLLGSISLFGMLTIMGAGARAKIEPGDTSLQGYFVAVTLVEYALGVSLCGLLLARYVVTRVLLKRMEGMEAGEHRLLEG